MVAAEKRLERQEKRERMKGKKEDMQQRAQGLNLCCWDQGLTHGNTHTTR